MAAPYDSPHDAKDKKITSSPCSPRAREPEWRGRSCCNGASGREGWCWGSPENEATARRSRRRAGQLQLLARLNSSFRQCSATPATSPELRGGWRACVKMPAACSERAVGPPASGRVSLAGDKRQGLPCILGDAQLCAMRLLRRWAASMRSAARGAGGFSGAVVGQRRGARAPRALLNDREAWAGDLSLSGAQL